MTIDNLQLTNEKPVDYAIFNAMGQTVQQGSLLQSHSILNIESLPKGIYYLRVANRTVKIIKS